VGFLTPSVRYPEILLEATHPLAMTASDTCHGMGITVPGPSDPPIHLGVFENILVPGFR